MLFDKVINVIKKSKSYSKAARRVTVNTPPSILSVLSGSLAALKRHEDEINRLNVYPVPDGDTGTNMAHTMQNVLAEAKKAGDTSLTDLMKAVTYGSLMGARGNSGVILSQIIRGICDEVEKEQIITPKVMARAIRRGSDIAYQAVKTPVEGTMLTVIRDMAKAAEGASGAGASPISVLEAVIEEGKKSVERTPALLPVLRESGVVDAGGYALVIMARGMLSVLKGERFDIGVMEENIVNFSVLDEDIKYAYCTEFMLKSDGIDMKALEVKLDHLGDSMLVVGTRDLTRIHIHTNEPGKVLQIATDLGTISNVQINNMIEQTEARNLSIQSEPETIAATVGVVAVANGKGIMEILSSMGVDKIVSGGQSMNPSTADILAAIDEISATDVIVLPNNKNIILAAQQAAELTHKNVTVIPTKSIPEAFAALMAYDKVAALVDNVDSMMEAFRDVKTGEVTYAVRDDTNGEFKKNDFIGLYNKEIKTTGKHLLSTALNLIEYMLDDSDEVVTILAGDKVSEDEVVELTEVLNDRHPDIELDIHKGDQPVYHFIIGIE